MSRCLLLLTGILLLVGGLAFAQTTPTPNGVNGPVRQFGAVTANHCVKWKGNNYVQDTGTPCGSGSGAGTVTNLTAGTGLATSPSLGITTTGSYSLLQATTTGLGGIVVGTGLSVSTTGVLSGNASLAVTATTGNTNFQPLFATGTGATVSTIYVDPASPLTYNPSTGLLSSLGVTTTTLTANGNAVLSGTTTISTARVMGGTVNGTSIGATTSSTAIFSTTSVGAITDTGLGVGFVQTNSAGTLSAANLSPRMLPLSLTTTDTAGNLFPYSFIGTGGNASPVSPSWGVAASLSSDVVLQGRFLMPHVLPPSGSINLVSLCQAAAGSGTVKYTISDADVAAGSDPSAASLSAETQTSLSVTVTGGYLLTATPLTETPAADHVSVVSVKFQTSGWTLAQILACNWFEQFQ